MTLFCSSVPKSCMLKSFMKAQGMFGQRCQLSHRAKPLYCTWHPCMRRAQSRATCAGCVRSVCFLYLAAFACAGSYDGYMLRTTSYDMPTEGKSAFAMEMSDLAIMMRDASPNSLLLLDELGKGTSSKEAAAFAGERCWRCLACLPE